MKQKTEVNQVVLAEDGHLYIRFALLELDDDGNEVSKAWHRTAVMPGGDVDAQLASVDEHLAQMGKAPIDKTAGMAELKQKAASVTPAMVEAYRARINADLVRFGKEPVVFETATKRKRPA